MGKTKKTVIELTKEEKQQRIDDIHAFTVQHHATQPQKVVELLTEAIEICHDIDNISMLVRSMSRKAVCMRMMLLLDESLALLKESLNIALSHNLEAEQANISSNIAIVYFQRGEHQKAKIYYRKSAEIYERNKMYRNQIANLSDLAAISIETSEYTEGFSYCQRAFVLCDVHKIYPYPVVLLTNTALIHKFIGNMEKAVYYYYSAHNVALDAGRLREQSMALHNIAECYYQNKDLETALQYSLRAIETHKDIGIPVEKQTFYLLKAQILFKLFKKEESYQCLDQAWKICEDKTLPEQKIVYLQSKAEYFIEEKKYNEAEICLEEALVLAKKHQMQSSIISSYQLKGKIPPVGDQIDFLLTALRLSETYIMKQVQPDIHRELSALYESAGDTEKSLMHFKKYYELKEKMQAEKHLLQMEIANVQHATEKVRQEAEFSKAKLKELTTDVIQKSQVLSEIRQSTQEALLQQGLIQKKTLHKVIEVAESGASSFWTLLEERASHVDGSLTEKILKICPDFTTVQLRIILLLKERMSNKEIAQILFVSERTVEYHRNIIRKKLNLGRTDSISAYLATL